MFWKKNNEKVAAFQKDCKMPNLSGIDYPLMNRLLVRLLVPESGISKKAKSYRTIFIRLIDKAIREYYQAREAFIDDMLENGQKFRVIEFMDHIETCINAISRLFKLLKRIKTERESPKFPREIRELLEGKSESVTTLRNSVEHMDEKIRNDEITPGNPTTLSYNKEKDGINIANYEVSFQDLAIVLEKMNEIAQYILRIKEVPTALPEIQ